ncbi:MAG: hypothetical protein FWC66_01955 [Oscillospiraceae bacterium]|nr:hypothetical protein [Oscillospiraceae bacterium]
MKINYVGNTPNQYPPLTQNSPKNSKSNDVNADTQIANPVDTFTPSAQRNTTRGIQDIQTIENLWRETNHHADAIRKLVRNMLDQTDSTGQTFWAARAQGNLQLSETDRVQAQQMISDEGFFGVTQTTDRIMSFAKALVGEGANQNQIESMRAAVQAGFDQVAQMFGGFENLPEVTRNTHAAIMQAFDDWSAGNQTTTTQTA